MKKTPTFKHIEVLATEIKINNKDLLLIGAYRPPKVTGKDYYLTLEGDRLIHYSCGPSLGLDAETNASSHGRP